MAVTFVIGRAGSGKTARCFGRIVQALRERPLGPAIFWLVPKQATFAAERELTCATGGFSRVRVVSFDLLGRQIAAEGAGAAVPEVTPIGRQMIVGHLLRRHQPQLEFFASVARRPGLPAELDAAFAEFERSGKTSADLGDLLDQLRHADPRDAQGPSLQAKLRDLRLLYDAYTRYLGQERLDPHRRLAQVLETIGQSELLRGGATAYVDGFTDFSDHERRVLAGLGQACASVEVNLALDPASPTVRDPHRLPDELCLFHRTEEAYRKLWFAISEANVKVTKPVLLRGSHRFTAPTLARIERSLFVDGDAAGTISDLKFQISDAAPAGPPPASPSAIRNPQSAMEGPAARDDDAPLRLIIAPDPTAEVDAAAREIRSFLQRGLRLRDVVVLVRDLDTYHALIDRSFGEHGLPYFVDRRRTAAHHPLLQFTRSALQLARGHWPHPVAMTFLKSGLAGVSLPEADEVEAYLAQHRLRGRPWDEEPRWSFQRRPRPGESVGSAPEPFETRTVDLIRQTIVDRLRPLRDRLRGGKPIAVRDAAVEVFHAFERFGVRRALDGWIDDATAAGDLEQAGEHRQVWAELADLFEQMVDLLGDEQVTPAEFIDVLESGLERFDLALTPPTVDQVLVGQVDRTRTPAVRAAIVLGLNEGQFPRVARDTSILSYAERRELRRRKMDLDDDAQRRQLDERLLAYVAFTRASERLVVTRPLVDEAGRPVEASPFWHELRRIVPGVQLLIIPRDASSDLRQLATPRQVVTAAMGWARDDDAGTATGASADVQPAIDPRAALYQWLATRPRTGDAIDALLSRAWPALGYRNEASLTPALAAALFPAPLRATAGQLETFSACAFRHFMKHGMGLADRAAVNLTALDLSHVYHEVLEIVVGEMLEQRQDWRNLSADAAGEMVRAYAGAVAQRLRGEVMIETARSRYLLQRVERTLVHVLEAVRATLARGRFAPISAGVRFGEGGRLPPLEIATPGGSRAQLRGEIDRVDRLPDGDGPNAGAAVVYDYKLAGGPLPLGQVYHGLSLQLLTYLLVLEAHGEPLAGRALTPVAAFAVRLLRGLRTVDHPDDEPGAADPDFALRHKPRGVFDGRFLASLDTHARSGEWSAVVQAHLKGGGEFGHRDRSDVADAGEFASLLGFVRLRIGQLADDVMAGRIDIAPYRIGRKTPCAGCEYRPVCRFEPTVNGYRHLAPLRRADALDRIAGRFRDGG